MEEDREGEIEDTEGQIEETPQSNSRARRVVLWLEQQHIEPFSNRSGPLHGHLLPEGAATRTTGVQSAVLKIHVANQGVADVVRHIKTKGHQEKQKALQSTATIFQYAMPVSSVGGCLHKRLRYDMCKGSEKSFEL